MRRREAKLQRREPEAPSGRRRLGGGGLGGSADTPPRKPRHPLIPRGKDGRRDQGPDPDASAQPTWGCWAKLPSTAGSPGHTNTLAGPRTHLTQKP